MNSIYSQKVRGTDPKPRVDIINNAHSTLNSSIETYSKAGERRKKFLPPMEPSTQYTGSRLSNGSKQ